MFTPVHPVYEQGKRKPKRYYANFDPAFRYAVYCITKAVPETQE